VVKAFDPLNSELPLKVVLMSPAMLSRAAASLLTPD
jgi:hypothetical protein